MRLLSLLLVVFGCSCSARETPSPPPRTAADMLADVRNQSATGGHQEALRIARELLSTHGGSLEADSVARRMPEFEAADSLAREAEAFRAAQADTKADSLWLAQKWTYLVRDDPMTSRKALYARIESENTVTFDFPYQGAQHGTLTIRDHPTYGRDVIFSIERGQILCHSYDCQVRVRFDDEAPQLWGATGSADNSSTSIFFENEARFVRKLRAAKVLRIQVRAFQEGEPMFEFHVGGFSYAKYRNS